MNKTKQLFAGLIILALGQGSARAEYTLNLMKGVTKVSNDVYDLHMLILWICVIIGIGVFGTNDELARKLIAKYGEEDGGVRFPREAWLALALIHDVRAVTDDLPEWKR